MSHETQKRTDTHADTHTHSPSPQRDTAERRAPDLIQNALNFKGLARTHVARRPHVHTRGLKATLLTAET